MITCDHSFQVESADEGEGVCEGHAWLVEGGTVGTDGLPIRVEAHRHQLLQVGLGQPLEAHHGAE